jgi:catechol 2,3-dioxygenase
VKADYRLPASTRVGAVRLQVADLERSLAYYQGVLGFRLLERDGRDASLGSAGGTAPLVRLRERHGAAAAAQQGRLGLYHFAILLPERPALGRFLLHLAERGERAGASDHLVSEALYLRDPDGLGIEVYVDRPRSAWQVHDGQISMATNPLDVDAVIAAAGGTRWAGLPAGSTIGHVHLHVGDLERASRFYHAALGLDRTVWSYRGALFLSAGGYHHHLGVNSWAGPSATAPPEEEARLIDWDLVLPAGAGIEGARASLESAGFQLAASGAGWTVADPWGTVMRLCPETAAE